MRITESWQSCLNVLLQRVKRQIRVDVVFRHMRISVVSTDRNHLRHNSYSYWRASGLPSYPLRCYGCCCCCCCDEFIMHRIIDSSIEHIAWPSARCPSEVLFLDDGRRLACTAFIVVWVLSLFTLLRYSVWTKLIEEFKCREMLPTSTINSFTVLYIFIALRFTWLELS